MIVSLINSIQMSKGIEDYRNIIKILKLQLLKIREENTSISHALGIASESETSSFTPKINHYKDSKQQFAKNILVFLLFAHRCEFIGVTPEMVFRIADKKRDKKVSVNSFGEILKRVKLRMTDVEINQLTSLVKKDNSIHHEDYLQALSAFQVNSEKYPAKGARTYVQLSLLKFGKEAKQFKDADNLYLKMNKGEDRPYLTFQVYADFAKRNMPKLQEYELMAVFVGLDLMSECQIEKSVFRREVGKVYSLLERGVNVQEEMEMLVSKEPFVSKVKGEMDMIVSKEPFVSKVKGETEMLVTKEPLVSKIKGEMPQRSKITKKESMVRQESKPRQKTKNEDNFQLQQQTGEQAATKKKPAAKKQQQPSGKQIKLSMGNSKKVVEELKKLGIRISDFMQKIMNQQSKKGLVRSFTIYDVFEAAKTANRDFPKKKSMQLFKQLDTERNGTIDTAELLKLWIRAKEMTDSDEILYRLLYRHLREIQYADPLQRFQVLGIKVSDNLSEDHFKKIFQELQLEDMEVQKIMNSYIGSGMAIQKFCEKLKSEGKPVSSRKFNKMDANVYNELKSLVKKITDKRNGGRNCKWRKMMRLEETGEKSTAEDYWEFIFTDEWACWQYCLDVASKLDSFWRDPEFGPTKSDPSGIRSIVGNESDPPRGLPDESEIQWMTFEQLLQRKKVDEKINFLDGPLNANQVMQGSLGDCWYISSLSIIANKEEYIKGVPFEQCKKDQQSATYGINPYLFKFFIPYGLYVFKFFKKFQPVYVVVDDVFPVQTSVNELLFAKSPNAGMQWPAFLEKAYAKLHHSFSSMISGDIAQGLNDLTNSLPIKQTLQKQNLDKNMQKIKRLNDERQLMGCSITADKNMEVQAPVTLDDEKCGLFYSHAYSIIDFLDLNAADKNHFDLIRVRNPWGHSQWLLDWSDTPIDNNPEYQKLKTYQKDITGLYQTKKKDAKRSGKSCPDAYAPNNDGEFLMSFADFNSLYTNLFTGFTIELFNSRYEGRSISEKWDTKMPSGICKLKAAPEKERVDFVKNNYQYILEVEEDETDVLMYIIQEDGRLYRGEKYPYKQLCNPTLILTFTLGGDKQLSKFDEEKLTFKSLNFQRRREVNLWSKFKKGRYAVVPCKMKNNIKDSDFQFRIYSQKNKKISIKKLRGSNDFKLLAELGNPAIDSGLYSNFLTLLEKGAKK